MDNFDIFLHLHAIISTISTWWTILIYFYTCMPSYPPHFLLGRALPLVQSCPNSIMSLSIQNEINWNIWRERRVKVTCFEGGGGCAHNGVQELLSKTLTLSPTPTYRYLSSLFKGLYLISIPVCVTNHLYTCVYNQSVQQEWILTNHAPPLPSLRGGEIENGTWNVHF